MTTLDGIEWRQTPGLIPYPEALAAMDARVAELLELAPPGA